MSRTNPIEGVTYAEFYDGVPSFVRKNSSRGRKGTGIRYERAVQKHFDSLYGAYYISNPWIAYSTKRAPRVVNYAQPDGLLIQPAAGTVTIVEIKYTHCEESYYQLVEKYLPLIKFMFSEDWEFPLVEVVRWYDKDVFYPAPVRLCPEIDRVRPGRIGVHICNTK